MAAKADIKFIVNNKIEIIINDEYYKSDIQDVTESYVGISIPVKNGSYLPLSKGDKVEGLYYFEKEVYRFNTFVIGRKIDKILIIMLQIPKTLKITQRRNFVRLPINVDLDCALINKRKSLNNIGDNQFVFFKAATIDISGGGVQLVAKEKLQYYDELLITLPMIGENITVSGKVVRISKIYDKYKYGITFQKIDNRLRENIIKFIFETMREQRRRASGGV